MVGRTISHYEITEKLGEGGMGVVYKARDSHLERFVALKVLPPDRVSDPERKRRFVREAKAASALNHPNIVTIYDIDSADGIHFIAMEYIAGHTLDALIPSQGMPIREAADCAAQMADALAKAHSAGITHRDLKPANIMVTENRLVKILDFGLAKLVEPRGAIADEVTRSMKSLTGEGRIIGTLPYMSPEQAQGKELDHRTDIFSLGVVFYQMATGERPFRAPNWVAMLQQILNSPTPSPKALRPHLPEAVERIVFRATAKNREERYQSMAEMSSDLHSLKEGPESAAVATVRPPRSRLNRLVRRRTASLAALAALAVVLGSMVFRQRLGDWIAAWMLPDQRQIAVLPFVNVGQDPANRPLCDGLMETLSTKLSQLQNFQKSLSVVPASEVRREKLSSAADARRVFGVNLAMTGSVQLLQNAVRVTINLVDTKTRRLLRSDVTDAPTKDSMVLQDEVFAHAAAMLALELTDNARTVLSAGETRVPAAYYAYIQALGYLSRFDVVENVAKAIPLLQQAVQEDPQYALAHAGLGEAFWRMFQSTKEKKWAESAEASCLRAVQLDTRLPNAHVTLGMVYRDTGRHEKALDELQTALRIDPMSADGYRQLARTYEVLGRTKDAEQTFQKAIALRRDLWTGYLDLGDFFYRHSRYDQAAAQFQKVIGLVPDHYRAYYRLGGIYYLQGKFDEATAMFEKSISIRPTPEALSNLSTLYFMKQRYSEAVPVLEKAVKMGTASSIVWGNLGEAYRQVPRLAAKAPAAYSMAIKLAKREIAVNPKDGRVRASLAGYLAKLGQNQEAIEQIEQARRLEPNNQNVLFRSAVVYETIGQREEALRALGAAISNGYSMVEIEGAQDLAELRNDPRYRDLVKVKPQP
jgi:serine/threonine protein kinase/Tfp pilus assembly protein PilF